MLISCEKCSTTYVLDDALIPPQGAPVQCTKCQHVFTAKLPSAQPEPPQARPGGGTLVFGSVPPAVAAAQPPAPNPKATMVFGSSPVSAPPAKNQTMMFGGAAGASPPAARQPAPAAPVAPKNQTMMFGGAAASAPPPAAAPAPPAKNQTMMFGGAAASAPPPAAAPAPPAKNQTMMFGGAAASAPPPAAAPAPPAKNQTMMFGGAAASAPPPAAAPAPSAKNQTMMFGAPAVPPAAAPPSSPQAAKSATNQTMIFGAPAPAAPAAPAPSPSSKQTMVFGAVAPAAPKNQAMAFGTAASNAAATPAPAAPAAQSAKTEIFGATPQAPQPKNQTMMFGRPAGAAGPSIPKVTAGTVELAGIAADENQPNESTVRVDVQSELSEPAGALAEPDAPAEETISALPDELSRHDRTQRFAMTDERGGTTPPGGSAAPDPRHNRTQLFAMSTVRDATDSDGEALVALQPAHVPAGDHMVGDSTLPPTSADRVAVGGFDLATTLPPDEPDAVIPPRQRADPRGVSVLQEPNDAGSEREDPAPATPVATTLPNLAPFDSQRMEPLPLELPPEPGGSPQDLMAAHQRLQAAQEASAETVQLPRSSGGAGRVIVIILALVALALAGVLAWRIFLRQGLSSTTSSAAIRSTEDVLAGLRRDDGEAQEQAIAALKPLIDANPGLHEAHAAMVLAAALRLDDARALASLDEEIGRRLDVEAAGEGDAAEQARARLETLQPVLGQHRAAVEGASATLKSSIAALRKLPPAEDRSASELAVLRAEAVAAAVLGEGESLALAERVRQLSPEPDNWAELAGPEFALNGGTSQTEALAELEAVRKRPLNSTFFRPYVLAARLRMMTGDDATATQDLTAVVSMNGKHVVAQRLLARLSRPD